MTAPARCYAANWDAVAKPVAVLPVTHGKRVSTHAGNQATPVNLVKEDQVPDDPKATLPPPTVDQNDLVEHLLQNNPDLTREKAIELLQASGAWDDPD
jgi:hypothetical protein